MRCWETSRCLVDKNPQLSTVIGSGSYWIGTMSCTDRKKTVSPIPILFLLTSNHTSIVAWFQNPQSLDFPRRRILTLKMSLRSFVALHLCLIAWFVSFNVLFWFGNVAWWRILLRKNGSCSHWPKKSSQNGWAVKCPQLLHSAKTR